MKAIWGKHLSDRLYSYLSVYFYGTTTFFGPIVSCYCFCELGGCMEYTAG